MIFQQFIRLNSEAKTNESKYVVQTVNNWNS